MLILAGRNLGYRLIFEPQGPCAAGMVADKEVNAPIRRRIARLRSRGGYHYLEFENIPAEVVDMLGGIKPVMPGTQAISADIASAKIFSKPAILCVAFEYADSAQSLRTAIDTIGFPRVIKTAAFGYDGKGQIKLNSAGDAADCTAPWTKPGAPPRVVIEQWIHHIGEFSVVCARKADGSKTTFPMAENVHVHHILHASIVPARVTDATRAVGEQLARDIADQLNVVGLIAVELFLTHDGELIINEMAPARIIQATTAWTAV